MLFIRFYDIDESEIEKEENISKKTNENDENNSYFDKSIKAVKYYGDSFLNHIKGPNEDERAKYTFSLFNNFIGIARYK